MKSRIIKNTVLILSIFLVQILSAQENKFSLSIEYSPNFSKLTDEIVTERYKISHNALIRMEYNTESNIKPTIGLGFMNTGELEKSEIVESPGIDNIKFIHNYNYLIMPIGAKIYLSKIYLLPEICLGYNISNKYLKVTNYQSGKKEFVIDDETLYLGEFNKISIPVSMTIGKEFKITNKTFSFGMKGYYGINRVVRDVPRKNHYYGLGIVLGTKL